MKDKHIIEVLNNIVDYLPKYQEYIQQLKDQGYTMIGYCRKSKQTYEDSNNRQRLLQQQAEKLKERFLVNKVFVSVCCKSSHPIASRDLKNSSNVINELASVDGDMQGNTIH
ncbi:MAG: hypothetical protein EXX96DRAFT_597803 [Benjaminiella poitrasii]|nr:MAG: hypothetical protein EXX96DRAFT_597803 [Benjaminiella poitrasii]